MDQIGIICFAPFGRIGLVWLVWLVWLDANEWKLSRRQAARVMAPALEVKVANRATHMKKENSDLTPAH